MPGSALSPVVGVAQLFDGSHVSFGIPGSGGCQDSGGCKESGGFSGVGFECGVGVSITMSSNLTRLGGASICSVPCGPRQRTTPPFSLVTSHPELPFKS